MRDALSARPPPFERLGPASAWGRRTKLWMSPRDTMSSLHHDGDVDNLNFQIYGEKTFVLVAPSQRARLHCYGSAESPVNPFAPDLVQFPRFAGVEMQVARLAAGDALLVPKYWWHCVDTVETSVNLSTFFHWRGELSPWRVLGGTPLVPRALTAMSAAMKRRGATRAASYARRAWWQVYRRVVPRATPQLRARGADSARHRAATPR